MSDVRLSVGGRYYTVACADGEEDHIRDLAAMIDAKLTAMGTNLSTNEAKNLLFAGLFLADDLSRAQATAAAAPPAQPAGNGTHDAARLERIAAALEGLADQLEQRP